MQSSSAIICLVRRVLWILMANWSREEEEEEEEKSLWLKHLLMAN